jgi:hypothetical protein
MKTNSIFLYDIFTPSPLGSISASSLAYPCSLPPIHCNQNMETGFTGVRAEKSPLSHLIDRGYAEKYRAAGRRIRLVGIVFDPEARQIAGWNVKEDA